MNVYKSNTVPHIGTASIHRSSSSNSNKNQEFKLSHHSSSQMAGQGSNNSFAADAYELTPSLESSQKSLPPVQSDAEKQSRVKRSIENLL